MSGAGDAAARKPPLLACRDLSRHYGGRRGWLRPSREPLRAVDGVSLQLGRSETLGLVGESGSGKSTLARLLLRLEPPTSGSVRFRGEDITTRSGAGLRRFRREVQIVFQDPFATLNPRVTAGNALREVLRVHGLARGAAAERRAAELLELVGLDPSAARRYPHEFSGGQRQRVGLARALAVEPRAIVADEPVSALDVSVQAQVLNLLRDLRERLGLTYLFISHDLAVVRQVSDRIAVMRDGRIVEEGPAGEVFGRPRHPYTRGLLAAVPRVRPASGRHDDGPASGRGNEAVPEGPPGPEEAT